MRREPLLWACSLWIQYRFHTVLAYSLNSFLVLFCAIAIIKLVPHCKKLQPFPHSNQLGIVCFVSHNLICMIFVHDFSKPSLINPCELVSGHSIHHGGTVRDEGFLACTLCQKFHFATLFTITELQHHQFEPSARKHTCLNVLPEVSFCNSLDNHITTASSIWAICQKACFLECSARSFILQFSWQSHNYSIINLMHLPESMLSWMFCQKFHFAIRVTITELHHHQFEPSARKHTCLYVLPEVPFALLSKITKLKQQFEKHLTKSITATTTTRHMHRYSRRTS
jgi:hypothetical protein